MLFLDMFVFWCFKPLLGRGKQFSRLSHKIGPFSLGIRASLGKRRGEATGGRTMGATSQSWARRAGGRRGHAAGLKARWLAAHGPLGAARPSGGCWSCGRASPRERPRRQHRPSNRQATGPTPGRPGQCLAAAAGRALVAKTTQRGSSKHVGKLLAGPELAPRPAAVRPAAARWRANRLRFPSSSPA